MAFLLHIYHNSLPSCGAEYVPWDGSETEPCQNCLNSPKNGQLGNRSNVVLDDGSIVSLDTSVE